MVTGFGIPSSGPEAAGAGEDCAEAMRQRKFQVYAPYADALDRQNIVYHPMVWSAFGRPHAATTQVIQNMARLAARRRGLASAHRLQRRTEAAISVEIWRRAAKMVRACWPPTEDDDEGLSGSTLPT